MAYEEDWETSSGFALDGAIATITAAEFGFNANMGAGITCLNLTLTPEDGSDDIDQSFSVGGKFEANRDGSAIEGGGKINRNSNYGLLIESVKETVDDPGEVIGTPKEAAGWVGTTWRWGTIERTTTNPTTGVEKVSTKYIVTEFIEGDEAEEAEEDEAPKASAKKASAKKASAKGAKAGAKKSSAKGNDVDPELWAELVELAGEHDDFDEFVEAALELDAVANDRAAQKALMSAGPNGVWAAAGKDA